MCADAAARGGDICGPYRLLLLFNSGHFTLLVQRCRQPGVTLPHHHNALCRPVPLAGIYIAYGCAAGGDIVTSYWLRYCGTSDALVWFAHKDSARRCATTAPGTAFPQFPPGAVMPLSPDNLCLLLTVLPDLVNLRWRRDIRPSGAVQRAYGRWAFWRGVQVLFRHYGQTRVMVRMNPGGYALPAMRTVRKLLPSPLPPFCCCRTRLPFATLLLLLPVAGVPFTWDVVPCRWERDGWT